MIIERDKLNKWKLNIMKDNKIINYIAIPPTNSNRVDIISSKDLCKGYNYKIDCIIIRIINGEIKEILDGEGN